MGKSLLTEEQFSRAVVTRVRRERPDIRVRAMGKSMLVVEHQPGQTRMLSLSDLYQSYRDAPLDRDEVISEFLDALVYQEPPSVKGSWEENRDRIMPQLVPPSLVEFCREAGREMVSVGHVANLSIAFVVDEADRYSFIQSSVAEGWGVSEMVLLSTALRNLEAMNRSAGLYQRFGTGSRSMLVWETFDGYDASRLLLMRDLVDMAAQVAGNPVIAVPHRDYLVVFGDADPDFVAEMSDQVRALFESHSYPISSRLFTLAHGMIEPYDSPVARPRVIN